VISGPRDEVIRLLETMKAGHIHVHLIPGDCAFHSPLFEPLAARLADLFSSAAVRAPDAAALYANDTGGPFPSDAAGIRERLARHLIDQVEFMRGLESMYADGARVFVELGPKSVLANLVNENLRDRGCSAVSLDGNGGGLQGLLKGLGFLAARGVSFDIAALFAGRDVKEIDLDRLSETAMPEPLPKTAWLVNGGGARPKDQAAGHLGKRPPLNHGPGQGP
jgi:acyl transferase domain-containing protein